MVELPKTASGLMQPATEEDLERDEHGFTSPNLHRRLDIQEPSPESQETAPREYEIGVFDTLHSTRLTKISYHDEESETCEIP